MNDTSHTQIGIFDSGKGGLSVVQELLHMSQSLKTSFNINYLGDTKHFPYGKKTQSQLESIIRDNVYSLYKQGARLIVVACNTASIAGKAVYHELENTLPLSVICVTEGILSAYSQIRNLKSVYVIGTKFTINSHYYEHVLKEMNPSIAVYNSIEQDLVEYIENNQIDKLEESLSVIKNDIKKNRCDSILLGCTHYSFIKNQFAQLLPGITILDPSQFIATTVVNTVISGAEKLRRENNIPSNNFFVNTPLVDTYASFGE